MLTNPNAIQQISPPLTYYKYYFKTRCAAHLNFETKQWYQKLLHSCTPTTTFSYFFSQSHLLWVSIVMICLHRQGVSVKGKISWLLSNLLEIGKYVCVCVFVHLTSSRSHENLWRQYHSFAGAYFWRNSQVWRLNVPKFRPVTLHAAPAAAA